MAIPTDADAGALPVRPAYGVARDRRRSIDLASSSSGSSRPTTTTDVDQSDDIKMHQLATATTRRPRPARRCDGRRIQRRTPPTASARYARLGKPRGTTGALDRQAPPRTAEAPDTTRTAAAPSCPGDHRRPPRRLRHHRRVVGAPSTSGTRVIIRPPAGGALTPPCDASPRPWRAWRPDASTPQASSSKIAGQGLAQPVPPCRVREQLRPAAPAAGSPARSAAGPARAPASAPPPSPPTAPVRCPAPPPSGTPAMTAARPQRRRPPPRPARSARETSPVSYARRAETRSAVPISAIRATSPTGIRCAM